MQNNEAAKHDPVYEDKLEHIQSEWKGTFYYLTFDDLIWPCVTNMRQILNRMKDFNSELNGWKNQIEREIRKSDEYDNVVSEIETVLTKIRDKRTSGCAQNNEIKEVGPEFRSRIQQGSTNRRGSHRSSNWSVDFCRSILLILQYFYLRTFNDIFLVGSRTQIIERSCRSSRKLGHGAEWYRIRNSTKWTKPRIGRLSNSQNNQKYLWKRIEWFRTNKVSIIFSLTS